MAVKLRGDIVPGLAVTAQEEDLVVDVGRGCFVQAIDVGGEALPLGLGMIGVNLLVGGIRAVDQTEIVFFLAWGQGRERMLVFKSICGAMVMQGRLHEGSWGRHERQTDKVKRIRLSVRVVLPEVAGDGGVIDCIISERLHWRLIHVKLP